MAIKIVRHDWNGHQIRQRSSDGFVNLTDMCKAEGRRVGDYLDLPTTKAYIAAVAADLGLLPENLVVKKEGRGGGTYAYDDIGIDCAMWVSMPFRIWANKTLKNTIRQAAVPADRILDIPEPGTPVFEAWFEAQIEKITGLHKNDIRNGKFYWEFVYAWLTPEERSHLNQINPVLSSGRRRYKIHDCLSPETKARLVPLQYKLMGKIESCNTVNELRRMVQRSNGIDQPNMFDGFWQSLGLIESA